MNKLLKKFGQKVKTYRKKKGLSQEQLAECTGLHRTYIGAIERGERNVSLLNIYKITNGLELSIIDLFSENEN